MNESNVRKPIGLRECLSTFSGVDFARQERPSGATQCGARAVAYEHYPQKEGMGLSLHRDDYRNQIWQVASSSERR